MQGDAGHIAAVQKFERVDGGRLHPAGADGHDENEDRALEGPDPQHFIERKPGPFLDGFGRSQPDINPERIDGGLIGDLLNFGGGGAGLDIDAGVEPDGVPRDERGGTARAQGILGLLLISAGEGIEICIETVGGIEGPAGEHAVDRDVGDDGDDQNAAHQRDARRDDEPQPARDQPDAGDDQRAEQDQEQRRQNGYGDDVDGLVGFDRGHVHDGADRILPAGREPQAQECEGGSGADHRPLGISHPAAAGRAQAHEVPQPFEENPDAVAGREHASRQNALDEKMAGNE